MSQIPEISPVSLQKTLSYNDTPIVEVNITILKLVSGASPSIIKRINRFYEFLSLQNLKYAQNILFKLAKKKYTLSQNNNVLFQPVSFTVSYQVTCNQEHRLSVIYDICEFIDPSHKITLRYADIWNLRNGYLVFFPKSSKIIRHILSEAKNRQKQGNTLFFNNISRNMRLHFNPRQIFLTENGMAVFYQQFTICPGSEGFQTFSLSH